MPLKDSPTYEALQKSGLTRGSFIADNFQDYLFVAFRQPELHLERSLFLTLLENTMIVDGKIVNIRQYVKDKYKGRYNNPRQYRTLERKINSEIIPARQIISKVMVIPKVCRIYDFLASTIGLISRPTITICPVIFKRLPFSSRCVLHQSFCSLFRLFL